MPFIPGFTANAITSIGPGLILLAKVLPDAKLQCAGMRRVDLTCRVQAVYNENMGFVQHFVDASTVQNVLERIVRFETKEEAHTYLQQGRPDTITHYEVPCVVCKGKRKFRCQRCNIASYCSKECSDTDWEQHHKAECVAFKQAIRRARS